MDTINSCPVLSWLPSVDELKSLDRKSPELLKTYY